MQCLAVAPDRSRIPRSHEMNKRMGCFVIIVGLFFVVGLFGLGLSIWYAWQSMQVASWPTTPGKITHLELKERPDRDHTNYGVSVKYTYVVDGVSYEGTRLAFGYDAGGNRQEHEGIYQKLHDAK